MTKEDTVHPSMIPNVNTYANAIPEPSPRANECHIGAIESTNHNETNPNTSESISSANEQQKV